jgi:hydroxyacylglutathione hydrolase
MIFRQFYLEALGHASYLVGSEETGEAFVLDVRRDVEQYYDYARSQGLRIRYAADTHQHNDYLTGITELQSRTPLELLAGARADLGYEAERLDDGQRLRMGEIEFEVLHTPGHTPEHISFLVRDLSRGEDPVIFFSGGALLVDDVARPDLLGGREAAEAGARDMHATLKDKVLTLPDHVLLYPTHVAGSLCGGNIGSMLVSTIGYERRLNSLAACADDADRFVDECIDMDALPTVPPYWSRMRGQNAQGPKPLGGSGGRLGEPTPLRPAAFAAAKEKGAVVLDCRAPEAFGGGHVPGALNVGLGASFPTWAGSVLPPDRPILLVLDRSDDLWEVTWHLLRIGYDVPDGWLAGGMMAWRTSGRGIEGVPQWTAGDLARKIETGDAPLILDVRQPGEWQKGHVPGAVHIPGGELVRRTDELPKDRLIAAYCGSGFRSSVATSLLRHRGFTEVVNVLGGWQAWTARGCPVEGARS